jgi:hypothetical protein
MIPSKVPSKTLHQTKKLQEFQFTLFLLIIFSLILSACSGSSDAFVVKAKEQMKAGKTSY